MGFHWIFSNNDMKNCNFSLPRDPELRNAWINALPKSTGGLSDRSKICSAHFSDRDMNICMGRRRLAKNAVPCLFKQTEEQVIHEVLEYQVSDPASNAVIDYVRIFF